MFQVSLYGRTEVCATRGKIKIVSSSRNTRFVRSFFTWREVCIERLVSIDRSWRGRAFAILSVVAIREILGNAVAISSSSKENSLNNSLSSSTRCLAWQKEREKRKKNDPSCRKLAAKVSLQLEAGFCSTKRAEGRIVSRFATSTFESSWRLFSWTVNSCAVKKAVERKKEVKDGECDRRGRRRKGRKFFARRTKGVKVQATTIGEGDRQEVGRRSGLVGYFKKRDKATYGAGRRAVPSAAENETGRRSVDRKAGLKIERLYGDTTTRWHRTRRIFHARSFAEVLWTWNGHRVLCCPWRLRYGRGSRHLWLLRGTTRQIFRPSAASVSFTWKTTANR